MNLVIHGLNIETTNAIEEFTEDRVHSALRRMSHAIRSVVLRVKDINGPRGGVNKKCLALIHLHHGEQLVIEDVDADLYRVLSRVASRTARVVSRHIDRRRALRRRASKSRR